MLTPLPQHNNVTVHYLRNDKEEITVAKEHTHSLRKDIEERAPLWETAFSGVRIDIQGEERDSIRANEKLAIPITYSITFLLICQHQNRHFIHFNCIFIQTHLLRISRQCLLPAPQVRR